MAIPWGHLESVKGCFGSVFGVSWGCFGSDIGVIRGLESGIECPWVNIVDAFIVSLKALRLHGDGA